MWRIAFDGRRIAVMLAAGDEAGCLKSALLPDLDRDGGEEMGDMGVTTKAKGVTLDEMMARLPPDEREEIERRAAILIAQEMALRDVRKAMGKTQAAVARTLGIKQENVARIEARSDMLLSTLRNNVCALGGDVHLTVELKGLPPVRLEGLGDLAPAPKVKRGVGRPAAERVARSPTRHPRRVVAA